MGRALADNYTAEVVDAIASAARQLRDIYDARKVVLVGHSGGSAIVADILGRHPDLADGALLVGCACDPEAWRSRMRGRLPIGNEPNPSLLPLSLVAQVRPEISVRLIVGAEDDVTLPEDSRRYAEALQQHGVDARLTVEPGLGHNILATPAAFRELGSLVQAMSDRGGGDETVRGPGSFVTDRVIMETITSASRVAELVGNYAPEIARTFTAARRMMRALVPRGYELVYENYNAFGIGYGPGEKASDARRSLKPEETHGNS